MHYYISTSILAQPCRVFWHQPISHTASQSSVFKSKSTCVHISCKLKARPQFPTAPQWRSPDSTEPSSSPCPFHPYSPHLPFCILTSPLVCLHIMLPGSSIHRIPGHAVFSDLHGFHHGFLAISSCWDLPLHPKPGLSVRACLDLATELSEPQQTTSPPQTLTDHPSGVKNSAMDQRLFSSPSVHALFPKALSSFWVWMCMGHIVTTSLSPSCSLQRQPMLSDSHLVSEPCSHVQKDRLFSLLWKINGNTVS